MLTIRRNAAKLIKVVLALVLPVFVIKMYSVPKIKKSATGQQRIEITGRTSNINGQAAFTPDGTGYHYFMWGMTIWEAEWENQRVKVIGDLTKTAGNKVFYIKDAVVQMLEN